MTITSRYSGTCRRCGGAIAAGEQIEWARGEGSAHIECPERPESLQAHEEGIAREGMEREVRVTEPGVYKHDGQVFIVKATRDTAKLDASERRMYAKRLVEINAQRATEAGERVQIEFEYDKGAIYSIDPADRMPLDEAKQLTIRYGRCIVCGRHLKAAESVERGIGPVCIKYFRGEQPAAQRELSDREMEEAEEDQGEPIPSYDPGAADGGRASAQREAEYHERRMNEAVQQQDRDEAERVARDKAERDRRMRGIVAPGATYEELREPEPRNELSVIAAECAEERREGERARRPLQAAQEDAGYFSRGEFDG